MYISAGPVRYASGFCQGSRVFPPRPRLPASDIRHHGTMDTPLILTHRTAWQIYHAPQTKTVHSLGELPDLKLDGTTPCRTVRALSSYLQGLGISRDEIDSIDLGVPPGSCRLARDGLARHAIDPALVASHTLKIANDLYIVDPLLCLLQATAWMSLWELVEFGYEFCGRYHGLDFLKSRPVSNVEAAHHGMPAQAIEHGASDTDPKRPDGIITIEDIGRALDNELKRRRGSERLRHTLRFIRDGSRSPMESGLAMLICLPNREGGLGIEDIEMNHRVDVAGTAKTLTKSSFFEIDIYRIGSHRGTEYDGRDHVTDTQREHDAERRNALEEMGYSFKVLTLGQFANQLSLHRAMNAVARSFGVDAPTDKAFQARQNELRRFIIRNWERQGN